MISWQSGSSTSLIVNASLLSRCVQFCFFFCPCIYGFALKAFRSVWLFFRPNVSKSCSDLFLRQCALNPHMSFWWVLVEIFESCHTDPGCTQWLVSINIPNNHRWLPHEVDQCSLSFVSGHQCNSEVLRDRPSEHRVLFLAQHDSDICIFPECSRNLARLRHLDLDLGLPLFSSEEFLGFAPTVAHRFVHNGT